MIRILFVLIVLLVRTFVLSTGCTNWYANYADFHKNALQSKHSSVRYLISVAPNQGLSDRLSGLVTHFLFALLTNRVFLIHVPATVPSCNAAFTSTTINCDIDRVILRNKDFIGYKQELDSLKFRDLPPDINKRYNLLMRNAANLSESYGVYLNSSPELSPTQRIQIRKISKKLFLDSNLTNLPFSNFKKIIIIGNRGFSYNMFKNRYHSGALLKFGLTPDNAFKCVFDFLYQFRVEELCPLVPVNELVRNPCSALHMRIVDEQARHTVVIGVHIRMGDDVFAAVGDKDIVFDSDEEIWCQSLLEMHPGIAGGYFNCAAL